MPTKPKPTPAEVHNSPHRFFGANHYYSELARLSAWLFIGVLALMTFLLTAGLQHPQKAFSFFVYASLIALPLNLVAFVIGHSLYEQSSAAKADDKKSTERPGTISALKVTRIIQQGLFILSVAAVTGLALVSAHIFFTPVPAPSPAAGTSQTQAQ